LRIAQRRLSEAKDLLEALESQGGPHPSISHNLAYVEFLQGRFEAAAKILEPWVLGQSGPGVDTDAVESLWLRILHSSERLKDAWDWFEQRTKLAELGPQAAGVASLIAVDLSKLQTAGRLSSESLRHDPSHVEALIARGSALMASGDLAGAKLPLQRAIEIAPHQPRSWATLGFVTMLAMDPEGARTSFEKARSLAPGDPAHLHGIGWAWVLQRELDAAAQAFEQTVALDPGWAESHGSLAVVRALQGQSGVAAAHAERARNLQRGSLSARYAQSILSGKPEGLQGVQRLVQQMLGKAGGLIRSDRKLD
jgi:Flp pilus assembly protein TadD